MRTRITLTTLLSAATVASLAATAGPARADGPAKTYAYTGGSQTVVVPGGAVAVGITMTGGSGGAGHNAVKGVLGGGGAAVTGYASVTPGATLMVDVGGAGHDSGKPGVAAAGGWGYASGGAGGTTTPSFGGGGGGGASAVVDGDHPLAIAGGGGGSGGAGRLDEQWDGAAGGSAGTVARDGQTSTVPGAGGRGGKATDASGVSAFACSDVQGGAGGGGGAGAAGGQSGDCGAFAVERNGTGGGGGGGAGSSLTPDLGGSLATAQAPGNGSVRLTWYTQRTCHDGSLVVDTSTPSNAIDLASALCAGAPPVASYAVADQVGSGRLGELDTGTGRATYAAPAHAAGIARATVQVTTALGQTRSVTLTVLGAPGGRFGLVSDGFALDGRAGGWGDPLLAETPTGAAGQRWQAEDAGDGNVYLVNSADGNCLTTTDLGTAPGTPLELDGCSVDVSNPVRVRASGDGNSLSLVDAVSGLPLEFAGAGPGARVVLGASDASSASWTLANPSATTGADLRGAA